MIVKNEARVIERCLASVRPLIDSWVITDTGSTDGTQDLIREALDGVPGELREEPWVDFGHNRTRNIQHARGKADFLLTVDADHVLRQDAPLPRLDRIGGNHALVPAVGRHAGRDRKDQRVAVGEQLRVVEALFGGRRSSEASAESAATGSM